MGDLIVLDAHRSHRRRPIGRPRPAFFFDLGCPLSYLAAERIERTIGDADWVPVATAALGRQSAPDELATVRQTAEVLAKLLRLPLVWPDRFPVDAPRALRAAAHAAELGSGSRFALAACRLAFCGGFDLEDPETLAEAAAAAGVSLDACLAAAGDPGRDASLQAAAVELRRGGVDRLPAVGLGGRLFAGEAGLMAAAGILNHRERHRHHG